MGKKGKGKKQAHEQQQEKNQQEPNEPKEQEAQKTESNDKNQEEEKPKVLVQVVQQKKIQYCPMCTFPFELCKYGKKASQCKKFLMQIAPTKVSKYHPEGSQNNQQQVEKQKTEKIQQPKQKQKKTVKDKYILIDVKQRQKKKFTSDISGLSNFDIQTKELAKKLCKKFACSCSPVDNDKITVQGDFFEDIKEILKSQYKIKSKYILDKDQYKEKVGQQKQKKKQEKKREKNVIPEQPQNDEENKQGKLPNANQPQGQQQNKGPKFKNKIQQALADLDDDQDNA